MNLVIWPVLVWSCLVLCGVGGACGGGVGGERGGTTGTQGQTHTHILTLTYTSLPLYTPKVRQTQNTHTHTHLPLHTQAHHHPYTHYYLYRSILPFILLLTQFLTIRALGNILSLCVGGCDGSCLSSGDPQWCPPPPPPHAHTRQDSIPR